MNVYMPPAVFVNHTRNFIIDLIVRNILGGEMADSGQPLSPKLRASGLIEFK